MITVSAHSLINCNKIHNTWSENHVYYIPSLVIQILGVGIGVGMYLGGVGVAYAACTALSIYITAEAILITYLLHREPPSPPKRKRGENEEEIEPVFSMIIGEEAVPIGEDATASLYEYLTIQEIGNMALVNVHGSQHANTAFLLRAKQFGYKGKSIEKAKQHLAILLKGVKILAKDDYLLESHTVCYDTLFRQRVDSEATLELLFSLSEADKYYLKFQLEAALLRYTQQGKSQLVYTLLVLGADPNCAQGKPLLNAVEEGNPAVIKILLKAGANPNCTNEHGFTPLYLNTSDPAITKLLLKHEANKEYRHPLTLKRAVDYARSRGHIATVQLLQQSSKEG